MANEFNIKNGFISNSNSIVLGAFTATTISATTYLNLPASSSTDIRVTGGTYNSGTGVATFTNNTGGTFTVTGFSNGGSTAFTGGTVTGATNFTNGLTANTMSATTYYGDGSNLTGISAVATEFVVNCRNQSGSDMYRGQVVYINSSTGNKPTIQLSIATGETTSARTFGVLKNDIANNAFGDVVTIGSITNLDTRTSATHPFTNDTLNDGDTVYLSPITQGFITNVKPSAPNHLVYIGKVIRTSPTNGYIEYQIMNGFELDELHNVKVNGITVGDLLTYSGYNGTNVWVNSKTLNGSYTITGNTTVGGSVSATTLLTNGFRANTDGITATTISATTYLNLPTEVFVTGGTRNNGSLIFTNNTGGTFTVTGTTPSLQEVYTASTVPNFIINSTQGPVIFRNDTGDDNNALFTIKNNAGLLMGRWNADGSLVATSLSATTYYNLPIDVRVTGGTYSSGTATFTNNTGGTFSVSGFSSGGVFTGGTVNGETTFTNGLIANTISATTYFNLPTDITVTGGTYSNGTTTFTNNTGGTFTVSGFKTDDLVVTGGTYSNGSISFTNNTGGTFNVITTTSYAAGVISGATGWTSTGTGQINLPAIKVALYNNAFNIEPIIVYDVATGTSGTGGIPSLADNDTNYVVIEYNNGTPIYNVYDNDGMVNDSSVVLFMVIYRLGNFINTLEFGNQGAGLANKLNDRFIMTDRFGYESGLSLGLSASTEVITLSAGVAWNGPNRQSLNSLNSQDDVFFKNYHSGGNWTYDTTGNTINNTYYDNGANVVTATGGKYLVNWYFRGQEIDDHLYEVYSTSEYDNVALAQLSVEPSLPELITSHAILLGRIIIGVGASTGLTESAFVNVFQSTNVTSHNDLTALQGGSAGQYYHLNSNQYNNLALTNTNNNFSVLQSFNNGLSATTITADASIITAVSATTISATTVTADNFIGDGSQITNVPIPYGLISAISSGNYLV